MLFKVIYHKKKKPCKTSETFDHGIWAAILISETHSVVSGVTASCNIKQVSTFQPRGNAQNTLGLKPFIFVLLLWYFNNCGNYNHFGIN